MDHYLQTLLIMAGVIALVYIGGPILIRFSQKMNASPQFARFDPIHLPPMVAPFFQTSIQALLADGFVLIDYVTMPDMAANVVPCVVYFINPVTRDRANITCIWATANGQTTTTSKYVEFCCRFANGDEINTNNNPSAAGSFIHGPEKKTFRFGDVHDPRMLFRLHQYIVLREARDKTRLLPEPGQEIAAFAKSTTEEFEQQTKTGLMYYHAPDNAYRLTWHGSFRIVWGQLPPFVQIKKAAMKKTTDQIMAEFQRSGGVGQFG